MFYGINEVAVIVSAILAIAVGSVWYSPLLFGQPWMKAVGFTEDDMEASKKKMPKLFVLGAVANIVVLYALAWFVLVAESINMSVLEMGIWITVLLAAVAAGGAVWEQKPLSYLVINVVYTAVVVIGGMHVIAYWPW